ncbi:MAG: TolC family protein [Thermoanaerobaculia bacterium]
MKYLVPFFLLFAAPWASAQLDWNDPNAVARAAGDANPSLLVIKADIAAARERVTTAASLPNPMLMAGVENQQTDLTLDRMMTMYKVGASQTITRPSRRSALRVAAGLDVERLEREYEVQRAEVERDAMLAYFDAAAAQSEIAATLEIVNTAKTIVDAARIRYESGATPQSDMIRSTLERTNLQHELLTLRGKRHQAIARLVALLQLPAGTNVPEFGLASGMHHEQASQEEPAVLPETSPALAALETEVRRADEEVRLARLSAKPDWNVEASYGVRPYEKDTISVTGRIELPIRKRTLIEPRIREATAQRDAALRRVEVLRQQLGEELGVAAAIRTEAREQMALHVDELVPQARLAFQSALVSYQSGKETFESALSSLQAYRTLNVDYYEFLRQSLQADADIDAIRRGARTGGLRGGSAASGVMQ